MFVVGPSQLENAGEGLFAARHIKRGTLVRLQHTRPMRKSHAHTDTLNFYITADVDDSGPCLVNYAVSTIGEARNCVCDRQYLTRPMFVRAKSRTNTLRKRE